MYVCMHVCMYECMYVCMHVCIYVSMYVSVYVSMHVSMYLCIYVCVYVCVYVWKLVFVSNTSCWDGCIPRKCLLRFRASEIRRGVQESGHISRHVQHFRRLCACLSEKVLSCITPVCACRYHGHHPHDPNHYRQYRAQLKE